MSLLLPQSGPYGLRGESFRLAAARAIRLLATMTAGFSILGHAEVVPAASCSQAAVQAAVNAVSSGGTVTIPAGTCTWSNIVTVTKAISIRGAGIGSTVINGTLNAPYGTALVTYSPNAAEAVKVFDLSGLTVDAGYRSGCFQALSPGSTTAITGLKIHDNKFVNGYSRAVLLSGLEFGVFFNNQFLNNYIAVSVLGSETAGWNYPVSQGGANYPFFENNTFTQTIARGGFIVETGRGGRIVFRNNEISGYGGSGGEVWDAHGVNGTYPKDTGTVSVEYYNNKITLSASSRVLFHRGGTGIVFNNIISGSSVGMEMTEYQGWCYCTTSGYPKPEQIKNTYYWANTINGSPTLPKLYCASGSCSACGQYDSAYIQINRDYWLPSSGPDASKPAACAVGARYGTTDTGKVYACNTANVWTNIYTPYTYPHPLVVGGGTPPLAAPPAPNSLSAIVE